MAAFLIDLRFHREAVGFPFAFFLLANGAEVLFQPTFGVFDPLGAGFKFRAGLQEFDAFFLDFRFDLSAAAFALRQFEISAIEGFLPFVEFLFGLRDPHADGALFLIELRELGEEALFALLQFLLLVAQVLAYLIDLGEESFFDDIVGSGMRALKGLPEQVGAILICGGVGSGVGRRISIAELMGRIDAEGAGLIDDAFGIGDVARGPARRGASLGKFSR